MLAVPQKEGFVQIISTKLTIPPLRPGLVNRSRLFQKLDRGLLCGFVLVSAPAGYGKSTLMSAWLRQSQHPGGWISLDDGDNEPSRFMGYLVAALRSVDPSLGEALEPLIQFQPKSDIETILTPLINQLAQSEKPFFLVLDDYHNIQNQEVHQIVRFLLEHRPSALNLIISTRADPPLPLARLRAQSGMVEIRLAELRFSFLETSDFLKNTMSLAISEADLNSLEASTEGWIAGLQMAGLSLQGRTDPSSFIRSFSGEDRYILDFLFDEVFMRQPGEIQDFLLQTSILGQLSAALCNAVTLRNNSREILDTLERNNLFLISLDEQRKWYRYHHLFIDLLKSRLKLTNPDSIPILHQRASTWCEAEHDLENAIAHALSAQDFERAASLIEQVVRTLDMQNQQAMLASWVDHLPGEILKNHPWLCVYRAWGCYWTGNRGVEEEWLQLAEDSLGQSFITDQLERDHIQGHIAVVRAHTALVSENIPLALEMGGKALELLPVEDEMRSDAAIALAGAYWALGDVRKTEQVFGMAGTTAAKINYPSMVAAAAGYTGIQQFKQGRLLDAIVTFQDGLRAATLADGTEMKVAGFLNARLGDVMRERNELGRASQYLSRGIKQCVHFGQPDVLSDAYICLGRYQMATGDLDGTLETLRKVDRVVQRIKVDPWILCWLDDCRIKAWLAAGNLEAASLWAQNSGLTFDGPLSYQYDLHHQNLARVLVAQGAQGGSRSSQEKAAALLARLQIAAEQAGWVHEGIKILLMQAVNDQAQGLNEKALQSLARALSLAQPGGYVRVFLDEENTLRSLLTSLADILRKNQQEVQKRIKIDIQEDKLPSLREYLSMLLAAFENPISPAATHPTLSAPMKINSSIQPIAEPLSEREMDVLKLLAQGSPDKKIAETLVIARETVHKHLKNIYGKLGVHSRAEAVVRARALDLI
jgi:LuxR family maltose regulon positive regulatory protein